MKIQFTTPHSAPRTPHSQRGVALVITLILLSVITFMAVSFLVLSQAQRNAVSTQTDQALARLTADSAQERAIAQLLSQIKASGNLANVGLTVSTNYINSFGFVPGVASPTNVNYDYTSGGVPLNRDQFLQNVANLWFDPRPPVFIRTNTVGSNEFRFYIDLNRNGAFEPTGWFASGNQPTPLFLSGDPQWVGQLEFPDRPHSANNQFIGRFAYIVQPASETLDVNFIHNYAKSPDPATMQPSRGDGFLRNQGAGTWEINLAALLADLNTNIWATNSAPYVYYSGPLNYQSPNTGVAFDDALALLRYRYNASHNTLSNVANLFGLIGVNAFDRDFIDGYSAGPPMTGVRWPTAGLLDSDSTRVRLPWSGADNPNHFQSTQEFFDPAKVNPLNFPSSLVSRLTQAGNNTNLYDRYTFYRLLSQLGTDSAPDPTDKINLNYNNLVRTNGLGVTSPTSFTPWEPIDFFTNAANKMLADAGFAFTTTNIQVYPTNFYLPSVHRFLQMAANIYDSTTNRNAQYPYLPSVFRPLFRRWSLGGGPATNVFIVAYREVTNGILASPKLAPRMVELDTSPANVNLIPLLGQPFGTDTTEPMVSGVPLVIGAKKGFPNFNEFSMQTYFYVSRLLEFRRSGTGNPATDPVTETNQMYVVAMTNAFGLECWNSYSNAYPRNLQLQVAVDMTAMLNTNPAGGLNILNNRVSRGATLTLTANSWRGWTSSRDVQSSLVTPWGATNNCVFLTNSTYVNAAPWFETQNHIFQRRTGFYVPHWYLNLNTRIRAILFDTDLGRIVDYVNLNNWERTLDITAKLTERDPSKPSDYRDPGQQWNTNLVNNSILQPTYGIINQIMVGLKGTDDLRNFSMDPVSGLDVESAVDGFRYNLLGWSPIYQKDQGKIFSKSNLFYAPFDPYRPIYIHTSWQANDPLVHYTVGDLVDLTLNETNRVNFYSDSPTLKNIGQPNTRFEPWGGNPFDFNSVPTIAQKDMAAKDPGVTRPDNWDFPTNKFANVGWLGRVHRGTPWQTIFLKSTNVLLRTGGNLTKNLADWQKWTGNPNLVANLNQAFTRVVTNNQVVVDAFLSVPTNDWRLVDLFTSAFNDNASRGKLSVNQSGLAGWSAVLAGVNVLPDLTTNTFIQPAGVYNPASPPPLVQIVNGINSTRTNFPGGSFQRLGDILATPQLTVASPYLLTNSVNINDEVIERIPRQILGLIQGGQQPRFAIYSYGQALKPAPRSLMNGGPFPGLCTNYQVTAEVATRTVVRVVPDSVNTNSLHTVIESFNVLPPD